MGLKKYAHTLKIQSFRRITGSHCHNFALRDLFCPLLESYESVNIKNGADLDCSIKSFHVTRIFLAKTGLKKHAHTLKIQTFCRISGSHGHNFALRDLFCPSLES